jgi:hypothetical protein
MIASSRMRISALLYNYSRTGCLLHEDHPLPCTILPRLPRSESTPIPLCVGIGCVTIGVFAALDKKNCSLYIPTYLCIAPSQVSRFRSPDLLLQRDQGFMIVQPLLFPEYHYHHLM